MLAQDQEQIKKYGLQYSSRFFAASTVTMLAILSYCIIKDSVYRWKRFEDIFLLPHKVDTYTSALILSSAMLAVFSLTLLISYGVFKYRNRNNCYNKEAGKIINNETKSVSGKMLISTSAIGAFVLACAILTASVNNQDVLSAMSRAFGFSKNGSWIGGLGGLLFCFIVSSLAVFAVSSVISFCFKGKNHRSTSEAEEQRLTGVYKDCGKNLGYQNRGKYEDQSKKIHEEDSQKVIKELKQKQEANAQLGKTTSTPERRDSNATIYSQPWDKNQASLFVQQPLQRRNSYPVINNPSQLDPNISLEKVYKDFEETAQSMKQKSKKPVPPPRKKLENKQNEGAADNGGDSILTKVESLRKAGLTI